MRECCNEGTITTDEQTAHNVLLLPSEWNGEFPQVVWDRGLTHFPTSFTGMLTQDPLIRQG